MKNNLIPEHLQIIEGTVLKTNYGDAIYVVTRIIEGCTCQKFIDQINNVPYEPSPEHIHLSLSLADNIKDTGYYLNGYAFNGEFWESVWTGNRLFILDRVSEEFEKMKRSKSTQISLF